MTHQDFCRDVMSRLYSHTSSTAVSEHSKWCLLRPVTPSQSGQTWLFGRRSSCGQEVRQSIQTEDEKSYCSSRGYEKKDVIFFKTLKHENIFIFTFSFSHFLSCRWEMEDLNRESRRFAGPTTVSVTRCPRLACCSYLSWSCEHMAEYEHLSRCHSVIAKLSKYDDLLALGSEHPATRGCFRDYWRWFVWNLSNRLATVSVVVLFLILYLQ